MSKQGLDDRDMPGYFLPEDSQLRLARLSDYIKLLARLAQPRGAHGAREWVPEVSVDELAFCFELLSVQVDQVLDEVSWPALRKDNADAPECEATDGTATGLPGMEANGLVFGLTPGQIDTLDRLIQAISAHGDVVAASGKAELAGRTLPLLGQAICEAAAAVRRVLDQVESQRLRQGSGRSSGIGEERALYATELWSPAADTAPASRPAYRSMRRAAQPCSVHLH